MIHVVWMLVNYFSDPFYPVTISHVSQAKRFRLARATLIADGRLNLSESPCRHCCSATFDRPTRLSWASPEQLQIDAIQLWSC